VPTGNDPEGTVMPTLPFTRAAGADVYPPDPCSVTVPVGVGLLAPPFTVAVNVNGWFKSIVSAGDERDIDGVINAVDVTVTEAKPRLSP
jgi:hypothetical protein